MKFKKIVLLLNLVAFLFTSCYKQIETNTIPKAIRVAEELQGNKAVTNSTTNLYDNYVIINLSQLANQLNRDSSYNIDVFARFSNNDQNLNMGLLTINDNININPNSENLYEYHFTGSQLAIGKSLFGTSTQIDVAEPNNQPATLNGQNILRPRVRTVMVVPKEIIPTTISLPNSVVNKATSFPLSWAPDPNNQFGKVQIDVSYYRGISQANASGMPNMIAGLSYQVADNGNFSIPSSDLNRFPPGSYIEISITRVWSVTSVNNVAYVAYVCASTVPLLVINDGSSSPLTIDFSYQFGETSICTATVSGGTGPYTYEWTKSLDQGATWGSIFSTSATAGVNGPCPLRGGTVLVYVKLKVTDNLGATQTIIKPVGYKCLR